MIGWLETTGDAGGIGVGLLLTTFGLGLRHGIDWDHLAAIADLSSGQTSPRRSMLLSTLYAAGHALVVLALGVAAILFAEHLPSGVDSAMERVVGATLVLLSIYVAYGVVRHRGSFRMRSRWMLVADGLGRLARRIRRSGDELVVIEHEHEHDGAHHHAEDHHVVEVGAAGAPSGSRAIAPHVHRHRHVGVMPRDPSRSEAGAAFGVGMLHGVGAETPTQVLVFLGAHAIGGAAAGVTLLVCFLAGLFTTNTLIAVAAASGFLGAERNRRAYVALSAVVALLSLVLGVVYLSGRGADIPAFFG